MTPRSRWWRLWAFALVCAVATGVIATSLTRARRDARVDAGARPTGQTLSSPPPAPFAMFRHLGPHASWGRIGVAPVSAPDGPRYLSSLACVRVHYAGGRGLCVTTDGPLGRAVVFDAQFQPQRTLTLTGAPSRARVSSSGRWGAVTVFEHGHSYADAGFSTRTTLIDLVTEGPPLDLEQFAVVERGQRIHRIDANFWGVTFAADDNRFYATLAFGGTPYLVAGDIGRREVQVLEANVECPSLSPDGTRLVFKRARPLTQGGGWRLWALDLATRSAHPLDGESRAVDDQVEWLDDAHVLYQLPSDDGNNVWAVGVDDSATARRFLSEAWSPAVVR